MSGSASTEGLRPKVSVCIITFNHKQFIRECLNSVLGQKTSFPFEVIVGDDCSMDGTREVLEEYRCRHEGAVRLILQERNTGGTKNLLDVHSAARGKYVAHIDGDDCAYPGKLQAQADVLDNNPDVAFAAHAVDVLGTGRRLRTVKHIPVKGSIEDLLNLGTYFVHSSVMYRRAPEVHRAPDFIAIDYFFHIERSCLGYIYYDARVLGAYRMHASSISGNAGYREASEKLYEAAFDRALELGISERIVRRARLKRRMAFAIARYLQGDYDGYRRSIALDVSDYRYARMKHRILHRTKSFPLLLRAYVMIRGLKKR